MIYTLPTSMGLFPIDNLVIKFNILLYVILKIYIERNDEIC